MTTIDAQDHHEVVDITGRGRPRVLMVVANPTTSTTTGWPVGFWAAELFHPLFEFTRARHEVVVASPDGGPVTVDALSDPRAPSRWSADDVISMGSLNTPEITALLDGVTACGSPWPSRAGGAGAWRSGSWRSEVRSSGGA